MEDLNVIQRLANEAQAQAKICYSDKEDELQAYISKVRNMLNIPIHLWTRDTQRIEILHQNQHLRCGGPAEV